MGFFSRRNIPNPMLSWGKYGPQETRRFIRGQRQYARTGRARQMALLLQAYNKQKESLTTGFEEQLKSVKKGVERSAASRGLGKSTIALALKPTETLTAQRQQALGGLGARYYEQQAGIRKVPEHVFQYMASKAAHGALEPWELYRQQFRGKSPIGSLLGGAVGGFFGGPMGAAAGSQIGGSF